MIKKDQPEKKPVAIVKEPAPPPAKKAPLSREEERALNRATPRPSRHGK